MFRDQVVMVSLSCVLPHNFGAITENLHVNIAGSVGVSHDVDLIEFSLRC